MGRSDPRGTARTPLSAARDRDRAEFSALAGGSASTSLRAKLAAASPCSLARSPACGLRGPAPVLPKASAAAQCPRISSATTRPPSGAPDTRHSSPASERSARTGRRARGEVAARRPRRIPRDRSGLRCVSLAVGVSLTGLHPPASTIIDVIAIIYTSQFLQYCMYRILLSSKISVLSLAYTWFI